MTTRTRRAKGRKRSAQRTAAPPGELLRHARERAFLTQHELASRLSCTQQAVAQAERQQSNPTFDFMRRWAVACGSALEIRLRPRRKSP